MSKLQLINKWFYWVCWNVAGVFSRGLESRSYWLGRVPRGRVVTRFPGTRQEEEKQNKPERAATACGLHWKGGLIISNTGTYTKRDAWVGVLKVSTDMVEQFCGSLLSSRPVASP